MTQPRIIPLSEIRRYAGGLHVVQVLLPAGLTMSGHHHDQPTIVAIMRGSMLTRDSAEWHLESEGSVQLLPPGASRTISTSRGPVECLLITADCGQGVGQHVLWQCKEVTRIENASRLGEWRVVSDIAHGSAMSVVTLEDATLRFLSALTDARDRSQPEWARAAIAEIRNNPRATAAGIARSVGVHPVHLGRVVRRTLGITLRELMRRSRVDRAQDLLRDATRSISCVAHEAAFADHSHMCREFIRRLGVSPGAYRHAYNFGNVASVQAADIPNVQLGECSVCEIADGSLQSQSSPSRRFSS
ncbi:MAG TPA: helix-turn-helix transcriptional regulator [Gemmatimonadaceae bacterium]|nr:helix-turn-helix transcriptional regulator [Gemmatimonadaceae bacterium]